MSNNWEFSEDEIRDKLAELGYSNIPRDKLQEFSNDLKQLIEYESSKEPHKISYSTTDTSNTDSLTTSYSETDSPDDRPQTAPGGFDIRKPKRMLNHIPYGKENNLYTIREMENSCSSGSQSLDNSEKRSKTKRKVLRRKHGESRVFDESFSSTDSGSVATDISDIEQQLRDLPLQDFKYEITDDSSLDEPLDYRPWDKHRSGGVLPSYIRPNTSHPHTRRLKKCDPVNRYRQFSREWQSNKVPGEKTRNSLRWNVRGQLLHCDVFERPQRRYVPNNYVVPTDKKRQSLRWEVRTNLAKA